MEFLFTGRAMKSEKNLVYLKVLRYNPPVDENLYFQDYSVPLTEEKINFLQTLVYIYREQDDTLTFWRYCCGLHFCNSCLMLANGKTDPRLHDTHRAGHSFKGGPITGQAYSKRFDS